MLVIGLTGGIGSGKSTVANLFAEIGVTVIDADVIARELVEPGMPALVAIEDEFGPNILDDDGRLDRQHLRQIIFSNPVARRRLEAILHPLIRAEMNNRLTTVTGPYCIVVIPLLFEVGQTDMMDRILVVDCPEQLQIERIKTRDNMPEEQIRAIIRSQATRDERLDQADDIIVNDSGQDRLKQRVVELHRKYLELAASQ